MQHLKVRCVTQKKEENNNNFRDMCRKCLFLDIKTIKTLLSGLLRSHNNVISVKRNVIQALSVQSLHVLRTKYHLIVRKVRETSYLITKHTYNIIFIVQSYYVLIMLFVRNQALWRKKEL